MRAGVASNVLSASLVLLSVVLEIRFHLTPRRLGVVIYREGVWSQLWLRYRIPSCFISAFTAHDAHMTLHPTNHKVVEFSKVLQPLDAVHDKL